MRTRLPVKLKLAVVTAALTFGILCLFAVVIGAVAEQRIRAGFDDDLRATAADLVRPPRRRALDTTARPRRPGRARGRRATPRCGCSTANGEVIYPQPASPPLAHAVEGISTSATTAWCRGRSRSPATHAGRRFGAARSTSPVATVLGYVQYAKPQSSVDRTVNRVRLFLAFGVLGGTLLAFLGGLFVAQRAMRPIAGLTRAAREVARTRDPDVTLPKPRANDEVSDLAHTLRGHAPRAERRARRDRGHARPPARVRGRRLARAAHAAHQHPGQPRAARVRAGRRAARDGRVGAALVAAHAPAGGRPAAARPRRRRPRGAARPGRPRRRGRARRPPRRARCPPSTRSRSTCPARSTSSGVADDLHRLAGNLVENALLHTPAGTPVTVSRAPGATTPPCSRWPTAGRACRSARASACSSASPAATGDGAPSGGSGLGLAIVKAVADAHGGRVELLDAEGGGARFVVTLPAGAAGPGALRSRGYRVGTERSLTEYPTPPEEPS